MAVEKQQKVYEFGDFRLIPDEGLLMRGTEPVRLAPKSFAALVMLVERRGHLVEKDEMVKTLWDDAFVEENAVSKSVWAIRQALGEDSKSNNFIQTVPKRGYRFVGDVSVITDAYGLAPSVKDPLPGTIGEEFAKIQNAAAAGESIDRSAEGSAAAASRTALDPARSSSRTRVAPIVWVGLIGLVFSASVLVGYLFYNRTGSPGQAGKNRLVVLPFRSLTERSPDPIYEFGIAESLILKLGLSRNLAVRQIGSVRAYAGADRDPVDIGKEQSVDYILASNYQLAGGRMKVTSQLFGVGSGEVEDTFVVDTDTTDPFATQEAVTKEIGDRVLRRFGSGTTTYRPDHGTNSEEAYRLYQEAMYLTALRRPGSLPKSVELLDRAVQLDPNYAQAWAGKARAHWVSSMTANTEPREMYARSIEAINRATALAPSLPDTYSALCLVKFTYEYDFTGAEAACKRALELGPDSSVAHQAYSLFLGSRGRSDEARSQIQTAIELDPTSYENHRFAANELYFSRRYDAAEVEYKRVIEMDADANATYNWLIRTLEADKKEAEAFDWFIKSLNARKVDEIAIQRYRDIYQRAGWRGVLRQRIETNDGGTNPFRLAGWYTSLGDADRAFEYLEKAYESRIGLMAWLQVEPQFDTLRNDPRYADLVRRIEGH